MKRALLMIVLLLGACEVASPTSTDCVEFDHKTVHAGVPVTCRMLWCENGLGMQGFNASGLAALWCDK